MNEKFSNVERADILDDDIETLRAEIETIKKDQKNLQEQANDLNVCIDRMGVRERALCIGRDKLANL